MGMIALGDSSVGTSEFGKCVAITGSPNVFWNKKPAVRVGDEFTPYVDSKGNVTRRFGLTGSATVFVNGKPAMQTGSSITLGDVAGPGEANIL